MTRPPRPIHIAALLASLEPNCETGSAAINDVAAARTKEAKLRRWRMERILIRKRQGVENETRLNCPSSPVFETVNFLPG